MDGGMKGACEDRERGIMERSPRGLSACLKAEQDVEAQRQPVCGQSRDENTVFLAKGQALSPGFCLGLAAALLLGQGVF